MLFINEDHQKFYIQNVKQYHADRTLKALLYIVGSCTETRMHFEDLYSAVNCNICLDQIHAPWQTGTSREVTRLAFFLFSDVLPINLPYYNDHMRQKDIEESEENYTSGIFFSPYFIEALKIRFPGWKPYGNGMSFFDKLLLYKFYRKA